MLYYSEIAKKKNINFISYLVFFFNKKSNFLKKRMFILDTSTSDSIKKNCLTNFVRVHVHVQGNKLPCIPSNYLFDASRREVQRKLLLRIITFK